jgi:hypothetical protein
MDAAKELANRLAGHHLTGVERREYDWIFSFSPDVGFTAECPWRILVAGRIARTDSDDRQKFGLPAPIDAAEDAHRCLHQKAVLAVTMRADTSDLSIEFEGQTVLELLNLSAGYEAWQFGARDLNIIALGGGELAIFRE